MTGHDAKCQNKLLRQNQCCHFRDGRFYFQIFLSPYLVLVFVRLLGQSSNPASNLRHVILGDTNTLDKLSVGTKNRTRLGRMAFIQDNKIAQRWKRERILTDT